MAYQQALKYIESFINYERIPFYKYKKSFKLERIKDFLKIVGNPQDALKCIHVAGSKGKGSTSAFIAYILREAGYKVGLYTSPHLNDFRERIRILSCQPSAASHQLDFEGMISKQDLSGLVKSLRVQIEKYNKYSQCGPLSFFEVCTAIAFLYFKKKKVDFAVLETGLGGRLDATNAIDAFVCVITPISYEHTDKLGSTLKEIAREKAGIIKTPESVVISAPQQKQALSVIRARCRQVGVKLYEAGKDIIYKNDGLLLSVKSAFGEYNRIKIRMLGQHQMVNAAVAIGAVDALRFHGINIDPSYIRQGIYKAFWPGRCEIIRRNPLVVLDGAQNVASVNALKETIINNFEYKNLILVLGISSDKDIKGICKNLYDLASIVILTKSNNPRAVDPNLLAGYFKGKDIYITDNVKDSRAKACRIASKDDLILVCGSLFVVGEFRK